MTCRLTQMGLKSKDGIDLKDIWGKEISSFLGMMIHGFPNCFMVYSPQGASPHSSFQQILNS